jgi:hypothetical protein
MTAETRIQDMECQDTFDTYKVTDVLLAMIQTTKAFCFFCKSNGFLLSPPKYCNKINYLCISHRTKKPFETLEGQYSKESNKITNIEDVIPLTK